MPLSHSGVFAPLTRFHSEFSLSPVNGAHAGHRVAVTHPLCQQSVPDLPGEHGGILPLVLCDFVHNFRGGHLGFGAADNARLDAACLIVTGREMEEEEAVKDERV